MTSWAVFMGGPADGQTRTFPGDEPPGQCEVPTLHHDWRKQDGGTVPRIYHRYRREVSQLDDGPLWVFVYEGARDER
jgi:hypothetical protein